jgi:hypothetical protein
MESPHHDVPEKVLERNYEPVIGGGTRRRCPDPQTPSQKPRWSSQQGFPLARCLIAIIPCFDYRFAQTIVTRSVVEFGLLPQRAPFA